jgi:hypothetical protein
MGRMRSWWARAKGQLAQAREDQAFDEEILEHVERVLWELGRVRFVPNRLVTHPAQAPVADPFLQMITLVMREECCSRPISLKVRQREG